MHGSPGMACPLWHSQTNSSGCVGCVIQVPLSTVTLTRAVKFSEPAVAVLLRVASGQQQAAGVEQYCWQQTVALPYLGNVSGNAGRFGVQLVPPTPVSLPTPAHQCVGNDEGACGNLQCCPRD